MRRSTAAQRRINREDKILGLHSRSIVNGERNRQGIKRQRSESQEKLLQSWRVVCSLVYGVLPWVYEGLAPVANAVCRSLSKTTKTSFGNC